MHHAPDADDLEAVQLINRLRSGVCGDAELSTLATRLDRLLPDPNWFAYAIDHEPALSAEEVVLRARKYQPIAL